MATDFIGPLIVTLTMFHSIPFVLFRSFVIYFCDGHCLQFCDTEILIVRLSEAVCRSLLDGVIRLELFDMTLWYFHEIVYRSTEPEEIFCELCKAILHCPKELFFHLKSLDHLRNLPVS